MKRSTLLLLVVLLLCSVTWAQVMKGHGAPNVNTPNSADSRFYIDESTGKLYMSVQGSPPKWVDVDNPEFSSVAVGATVLGITGAKYDGTDEKAALQVTIDAAPVGATILIPNKTIVVSPGVVIKSDISIVGMGPGSKIKVKANPGDYDFVLGPATLSTPINNFRLADLTIDQNCAANTSADIRAGVAGKGQLALGIFVGTNIVVERVNFDSVCGVNTVSLNGTGIYDAVVRNNRFHFVQGRTLDPSGEYDNTAVYLNGTRIKATDNTFVTTVSDKARGAVELHGSVGISKGNTSHGYRSITRLVSQSTGTDPASNAFVVEGNTAYQANDCINLWSITGHSLRGVTITGNTCYVANADHAYASHQGIAIVSSSDHTLDGEISDVTVSNNVLIGQKENGRTYGFADSGGIVLGTSGGNVHSIDVNHNVIQNFPTLGLRLDGQGTVTDGISITYNTLRDNGNDTGSTYRSNLLIAGTPTNSFVQYNNIVDSGALGSPVGYASITTALASGADVIIGNNSPAYYLVNSAGGYEKAVRTCVTGVGDGASISINAQTCPEWQMNLSAAGESFTIANPYAAIAGQHLTFWVANYSGATVGTLTWGNKYDLAGAWVMPANGYRRRIEFQYDGAVWWEVSRSPYDVPNSGASTQTLFPTAHQTFSAQCNSCPGGSNVLNIGGWTPIAPIVIERIEVNAYSNTFSCSGAYMTLRVNNGTTDLATLTLNNTLNADSGLLNVAAAAGTKLILNHMAGTGCSGTSTYTYTVQYRMQ